MKIELPNQHRADAIAYLRRYFDENMPEPLGELPAGILLDFFLADIAPAIYNQGVTDAQTRITQRASDLEGELYIDEFQYWNQRNAGKRK